MIETVGVLQSKYRKSGVILDSNLFLLLLTGSYDKKGIGNYKITQAYKERDFELLLTVLGPFQTLVTTSSILAEVSNLSGNADGRFSKPYFDFFIKQILIYQEVYPRSANFVEQETFRRLGLTDAGIIYAARQGNYLILTDDLPLALHAQMLAVDIINFTALREASF